MNRFDRRLTRLEQALCVDPAEAWRYGEGLAALLTSARKLPPRDPWDLPEVESGNSMARLLQEAQVWLSEAREREERHG